LAPRALVVTSARLCVPNMVGADIFELESL